MDNLTDIANRAAERLERIKNTNSIKQKMLDNQTVLIAVLVKFFNAVVEARSRESLGHNDGWDKVQKIHDLIEDNYDLSGFERMRPTIGGVRLYG